MGILEGLIVVLMLIPIALYYLVKWIIKGIIFLILLIKDK